MAGVRGDFAGLARLIDQVKSVTTPEWRSRLAQVMGAAGMKCLADSFRRSTDPYGRPWAPLKLRSGKPLLDTGRLRASTALVPSGASFAIYITAPYAATHQYGATIVPKRAKLLSWRMRDGRRFFAKRVTIPQRQMLPDPTNLGPIWGGALTKAADGFVRKWFSQPKQGGGE